jgi:hypothetical protein
VLVVVEASLRQVIMNQLVLTGPKISTLVAAASEESSPVVRASPNRINSAPTWSCELALEKKLHLLT